MAQIDLIPANRGDSAEDWYMEVAGIRVGYVYQANDGTWPVGVMATAGDGDIGPYAEGLPTKSAALEFARQNLLQLGVIGDQDMGTAQVIFDQAFQKPRSPRSDAYKLGVLECLRARVDGATNVQCPYQDGSAESDAYFAGVKEGCELSRGCSPIAGFNGPVTMTFQ